MDAELTILEMLAKYDKQYLHDLSHGLNFVESTAEEIQNLLSKDAPDAEDRDSAEDRRRQLGAALAQLRRHRGKLHKLAMVIDLRAYDVAPRNCTLFGAALEPALKRAEALEYGRFNGIKIVRPRLSAANIRVITSPLVMQIALTDILLNARRGVRDRDCSLNTLIEIEEQTVELAFQLEGGEGSGWWADDVGKWTSVLDKIGSKIEWSEAAPAELRIIMPRGEPVDDPVY